MKKTIESFFNKLDSWCPECQECIIMDLLPAAETNDQLIKELVEAMKTDVNYREEKLENEWSSAYPTLKKIIENRKQLIERVKGVVE